MTCTLPPLPGATADRKRARGLCATPFCRRAAGRGRSFCNTCRDRAWRARHPEHHLWNNLKKSAKRRGIEFTLTLTDWIGWCRVNDFVARVGRAADALTVDRRDDRRGYTIDNLRPLPMAENSARPRERETAAAAAAPEYCPGHYTPEEDPLAS